MQTTLRKQYERIFEEYGFRKAQIPNAIEAVNEALEVLQDYLIKTRPKEYSEMDELDEFKAEVINKPYMRIMETFDGEKKYNVEEYRNMPNVHEHISLSVEEFYTARVDGKLTIEDEDIEDRSFRLGSEYYAIELNTGYESKFFCIGLNPVVLELVENDPK